MGERELPELWIWTTLGDACEVVMGQSPLSDSYNTEKIGLPFYQGKAEFGDLYPSPVKWCSQPGKIAQAGDILISVRAPVGPTNLCREESCIGRGLAAIRPLADMPSEYWLYALRYFEDELAKKGTGTTFAAISGSTLRDQRIPLAPLPEQHRIVAKIESLFTRLDASVAALKRAQANLKRYKASVLKAACEGRLVRKGEASAVQEAGISGVPTADASPQPARDLLARILRERHAKWEADLIAKGKDPKKAKYEEPKAPETDELPELPEGWVWATVDQLLLKMQYGTSEKADLDDQGIPVIRMGNIRDGNLDLTSLKYMSRDSIGLGDLLLEPGDLLFNRTNSAELVGKTAVYLKNHPQATFASYLIRVKFHADVLAEFVSFFINSLLGRQYIASVVSQQVGQANVNGTKLANMQIPLPPLSDQRLIVAEVERRLSVMADMEQTLAHNLARAERMRQAILKKAFEGRLVEQDPEDEPAGKLLARIRAGRGEASADNAHETPIISMADASPLRKRRTARTSQAATLAQRKRRKTP